MTDVRVAGVGLTHFGSHPGRTGRDLFAEAALRAFEDADVDRTDVEGLNYGNFMGALAEHQGHQAPLMAEAAGVRCPATRYESACASAGVAVREAVRTVAAGDADVVLAGGMERMTNLPTDEVTEGLAIAADDLYEVRAGVTFPGAYALMANAYFDAYGGSREDLAHIASKNHENALPNEYAQYRKEVSVAEAMDAPPVAEPLHLYDACPITDGASALVLVSEEYAADHDLDASVAVTGTGQGTDRMALGDREHLARTPAADDAADAAYADAGVEAVDVDLAEVHDSYTVAEILAVEDLGFAEKGDGGGYIADGRASVDGETPTNPSGGLKACGHPLGATGVRQVVDATRQLRGEAGTQVEDASVAVTQNVGGTGGTAVVNVLSDRRSA